MFHYDAGLFLTAAGLGVDVRRRQPRCFVSHAHADHIARHELALATSVTARVYRPRPNCPRGARVTARLYPPRLGPRHRVMKMSFRQPLEFGGVRLTAYPAGH